MGLIRCDRKNCEAIMCKRFSVKYGYICDECFEELVSSGVGTDLDAFLETEKKEFNRDATRQYFEAVYKLEE